MRLILTFLIAFGIGYTVATKYPHREQPVATTPAPKEAPRFTPQLKMRPLDQGAYDQTRKKF